MMGRSKFVLMALVVVLFVSQAAALPACWTPMLQEMAMGDAGMTANMQPIGIQQGPVSGSCCQLSAANSAPVLVPRAPEYGETSMATTSTTLVLDVPRVAIIADPAKAQLRGSGSSRATLCVFLI
jgi:hypothetical protein